ncbi:MAG: Binding-protein-dependent transport systems inner membrane component [Thermotoga sp. 50_1627]|uniref:ABC transporter permease n=1 Tax=Pseudothermotoga sp. TaxID=2033661 RepID=UPI00076C6341|nr:MAG: Binding-protein-dependent transport systems inner membrane component [Thermotoga sp. 50_64]KUK24745.1 MAG: Binding-protein-dependent transport systems inner membrane component [Thermotoga sp. 50_1627]MBC7116492.1 ABC transporter permease [Pseudothermotoga sp.]MDK2923101.1 putative spermidine/putrescine transport system permease protein [Pseudothermotoga sp.]HBT40352.1 spermidine/putrescine ABC transporter ATP-binding protein [Pseudothermotoga sp.]
MAQSKWLTVALFVALSIMLGPFLIIFFASFEPSSTLRFPPTGFTLDWFRKVMGMSMFQKSLVLSLRIALMASLLSLLLGVPAAYALSRYSFKGKRTIEIIVTSPLIIPGMVAGLALLRFFVLMQVFPIETTLLIGHTAVVLPYAVRSVLSSLVNLPVAIEEAAQSLGAHPLRCFFLVVLPNIKVGIISAFIMAFITSFNNVPISLFLSGPGVNTLPIVMMTYMEYYYNPSIAALSTLLIGLTLAIVLVAQKLLGVSKLV